MPINRDRMPDEARSTVRQIEDLGFGWELDQRYPVPDVSRRIQTRDEGHYAPRAEVKQYAAAMARNDKFPPIVVTLDGYVIDGNTRAQAALENRYPIINAIVLDRKLEGAIEQVRQRIHLLGWALNTRHGRGIDANELRRAVLAAGEGGRYDTARIASLLNIQASRVTAILAEKKGQDRADALGLDIGEDFPASSIRRFGQALWLNDKPFIELFRLTRDAGLTTPDLNDLLRRVRDAGSDEQAMEIIACDRADRKEQISLYRATGKSRVPTPAMLRKSLLFVLKYESNPKDLVEQNPSLAEAHLSSLNRALNVLTIARNVQREGLTA